VPVSQDIDMIGTNIRLVTDRPKRCGREYTISGDSIVPRSNGPTTCRSTTESPKKNEAAGSTEVDFAPGLGGESALPALYQIV
jgi:hypothetical protein